ncbi:MAG TPA: protein-tyrosine-phosphatase, partial [Xanthobacteraceae bacterium]|nr:protein-tyrosine-phosphatase [Xanthobacteraceae bacterium]
MSKLPASTLTICGLDELTLHSARGVTHVVSILDPDHQEPEA